MAALRVFAKASLHPVSVVMAGRVQDGAATSCVRREISVIIATCRPLVDGGGKGSGDKASAGTAWYCRTGRSLQ